MKHPVGTGFPNFKERLKDAVSAWKKERAMLDELNKYIDDLKSQKPEKIDKEKEIDAKIAQYKELEKYFDSYETFLHSKDRIDFDDMVLHAITKLESEKEKLKEWQKQYDHIIIDEFQDNNSLQTQLAKLLSPKGHITVIGDEDQCIYTFQGAHVENFRNFKDDYKKFNPEEKILRINYRSTEEIVEKSQKLMNAERDRPPKNLRAFEGNGKGSTPELHEFDTSKAEFSFIRDKINELKKSVPLEDFVVLFRKNKETNDFI